VGDAADLLTGTVDLVDVVWADGPVAGPVAVQCSAHGAPRRATVEPSPAGPDRDPGPDPNPDPNSGPGSRPGQGRGPTRARVTFAAPERRVAPGQSVVLYDGDEVVGGGIAAPPPHR
jgi:hypothetical protein